MSENLSEKDLEQGVIRNIRRLTFAWEIEHAHHVLSPIFYSEKVIIEKAYYDNIEERLRTILREPTLILHRSNRPACKMKN